MLSAWRIQRGITLIELMIASAIALFALSVVLSVYGATARHSSLHLQRAHLRQQMHGLLQLAVRDIRRSGYWQFDPHLRSPADNPFQNALNRLRVAAYPDEAAESCILYAYDMDRDGLVGVGPCSGAGCAEDSDDDNVEQFGLRLRDGAVQSRYGGSAFVCDNGYWQSVTDPEIEVTGLRFREQIDCTRLDDPDSSCIAAAPRLERRAIELQLAARQRRNPGIALTLSTWIQVRNDRLLEGVR